MCNSFQTKGLLSTATGQLVVLDGLSSSAYFLVLEVFRLIRKVPCNRHSLPLHDFRRLVFGTFSCERAQCFAGPRQMDFHLEQLQCRCRICGRKRGAGRQHQLVSAVAETILALLDIDTSLDDPSRHPTRLCRACWKFLERSSAAEAHAAHTVRSLEVVRDWPSCAGDSCQLCKRWHEERKGGRPRKLRSPGRPRSVSSGSSEQYAEPASSAAQVQSVAGSSDLTRTPLPDWSARLVPFTFQLPLHPERFLMEFGSDHHLLCAACRNVLNSPMAVPLPSGCEHTLCRECWEQWLVVSPTCPICRKAVARSELQPAPRILWEQLCQLMVHCDFWNHGCMSLFSWMH